MAVGVVWGVRGVGVGEVKVEGEVKVKGEVKVEGEVGGKMEVERGAAGRRRK